jgi:hypothetical protein
MLASACIITSFKLVCCIADKIYKVSDNYIMESRHQKIGMVFTETWNQRRKSLPSSKHLQEKNFDNGNFKKCLSNFDVKLRKLYQQNKKGGLHTSMYAY